MLRRRAVGTLISGGNLKGKSLARLEEISLKGRWYICLAMSSTRPARWPRRCSVSGSDPAVFREGGDRWIRRL